MKAFVTDGNERSALAITRSLGRRGVSVLVGAEQPASLASSSRYCARHVTYPSPYRHPDAFRRFLLGSLPDGQEEWLVAFLLKLFEPIVDDGVIGHLLVLAPKRAVFEATDGFVFIF